MSNMKRRTGLLIFMFWVVVPTLDQYSDLAILTSLYTGPDPAMEVRGGRARAVHSYPYSGHVLCSEIPFPDNFLYNGTLTNQTARIQRAYQMVPTLI